MGIHPSGTPDKTDVPATSQSPLAHVLRNVVTAIALVFLAACATFPAQNDTPDSDEMLRASLPVAAAALAAGQLDVARRLYLSLAGRFDTAPEPLLGLGYIAFQVGEFGDAARHFLQAAERASDSPAVRAESLLGAGRTALVQGRKQAARRHFRRARESGTDTPSAPWIENGLAVIATLRADYEQAEAHFAEALRTLPAHPRITANFVRMLVAAGRIDDASRVYSNQPPTYWADGDGPALARLIDASFADRSLPAAASPRAHLTDSATDALDVGPASRRVDPSLALRLDDSSPMRTQPNPDTGLSAGTVEPEPPSLVLRLDRWPVQRTPQPAASDAAPVPAADAKPPSSGRPAAASGHPGDGTAAARSPGAFAAGPGAARSRPVPEPETPLVVEREHSAGPTIALILGQSRRLHLDHDASSVLVAAPEIADVRLLAPNVVFVIGKSVGRTSVAVLDDREEVGEWVVSVALDLAPLRAVLAGEPGLGGVRARRLTRGVALTGAVASAEAADRALRLAAGALPEDVPVENELRVAGPQQVNLEVQIAEVQRAVTEDLGVNWETFGLSGSARFGFRIGRVPLTSADGATGANAFLPAIFDGNAASSAFLESEGARGRFRAMIDALATAGLANVLARPNVTAVSGEPASFFSGGEFPLPTGFDDGVIVFEYKKYGVLLDFVPTVVDSGRIVLTVRPEVSEPSLNESVTVIQGVEVPVINVRRAETTVEVADGESIVIAGLFRNRSNTVESGVPVIKDVPLLGALFGHTSARSNELELIVVVTARLVEPYTDAGDTGELPTTLEANGYYY